MSKPTFLILCRPRSRSAWLANFLTYGDASFCLHEGLLGCASLAELARRLQDLPARVVGAADTGLIHFADEIANEIANEAPQRTRVVVLTDSDTRWHRFALQRGIPSQAVEKVDAAYRRAIERLPAIMLVDSLDVLPAMYHLWRWLGIGVEFPVARFEMLRSLRIEVDEDALARRVAAHFQSGGMMPNVGSVGVLRAPD